MKKLLALLLTLVMAISVVSIVPTVSAKSKIYKSNNCYYTLDKKGYATVINYYGPTLTKVITMIMQLNIGKYHLNLTDT